MRRRAAWRDVCLLALAFSVPANDAGAASGELRWSRDTGARVAAAGALVPVDLDADGQAERRCLIVGNSAGEVYAIDARTREDCWEPQRIGSGEDFEGVDGGGLPGPPADLRIAPVVLPGLAATVFAVPDGRVVALKNATGDFLWDPPATALYEDIEAPPTVTLDGTIIVGTRRGRIHRLDGATGERIGSPIGVAGAVHHSTVALPTGGGIVTTQSFPNGIVELDSLMREDPAEKALFEADLLPGAAPVVDQEGRTIFALGDKLYVRLPAGEMDDGEPKQVGGLPEGLALTPDGRTVWVITSRTTVGGGMLQAFGVDDESTSALAAIVTPSAPTGAPAIGKDGSAYVALRSGVVLGVDTTGRELFEYRSDRGEFRAEPVIGAGALYVGDTNGTVYALDLDESAAGADDAPWPMVSQNAQRTGQELLSDYKLPGEVLETVDVSSHETLAVTAVDAVDEPLIEQMMPGYKQSGKAFAVDAGRFKVKVTRTVVTESGRTSTEPVDEYSTRVYSVPVQRLEIAEPLAVPRNADVEIPPEIFPAGSQVKTSDRPLIWHSGRRTLYAATPGDWRIEWRTPSGTPFSVLVSIEWPRDPEHVQKTVVGASPVVVTDAEYTHAFVWPPKKSAAPLPLGAFEPLELGRSVIVLADAPNPDSAARLAFIAVEVLDPVNSPAFLGTRSATIGSPIPYHDDFPEQHQDPDRKPGVLTERARVNMDSGFYDREQRTGEIIPVNLDGPSRDDDILLAFYQRSTSLLVAGEGDEESAFPGWQDEERFYGPERRRLPGVREQRDVYWPVTTARYLSAWPEVGAGPGQARELVIAAPANELLAETIYASERSVYRQPDPNQPGYNPNEEHAYITEAGDSLWALRSDLNAPATSEPYVLVSYEDPTDGRAKMLVVKVVAESSEYGFDYGATAGDAVLAPPAFRGVPFKMYPLDRSVMLEDSDGKWWAYRAGHREESVTVVNHFCYQMLESFDVPLGQSMDCPYPGGDGMYSWLSTYSRRQRLERGEEVVDDGAPLDVRYVTRWPANRRTLRPGQTLTMAIDGLPQIHGVHGMKLLYQQSEAQGLGEAVRLLDVASPRTVALKELPEALRYPRTDSVEGNVFFPELPPNLRHQLYYDPADDRLAFRGQYLVSDGRVLDQPDPQNENSVLMNVMSPRAVAQIKRALSDVLDEVLDEHGTTLGKALDALAAEGATPILVTDEESDSDHLALVATDTGATGWVSFVVGNSESSTQLPEVEVIYVDGERDRGEVMVLEHSNPFAEEVYVRHSSDFGGQPENYEFEWSIVQREGESRPGPGANWRPIPGADGDSNEALIAGLDQIPNLWVQVNVCRRGPGNSDCMKTEPREVNGWLERVSDGVNVFDSVLSNFRKEPPRTTTNIVQQAGVRYRGAVPLSVDSVRRLGMIEVYETAYRRGRALSIDNANPSAAIDHELLAFAGRLADLYFVLANEAYADAVDPTTILPSGDDQPPVEEPERHAFRGQTNSLLAEELALLRGTGEDTPATRQGPTYNRLRWGVSDPAGAPFYIANYTVEHTPDDAEACGTAEDRAANVDHECLARRKYPQGHGDAYGHYLTGLKVYYGLIRNANFGWTASRERAIIGGAGIEVDYFDERKFAQAAVGRARTALDVVNLTRRRDFGTTPSDFLQLSREVAADPPGAEQEPAPKLLWGVADWASRGGQGAYLDWVVGNSMVPDRDERPDDDLLGRLDRDSVEELRDLAGMSEALQGMVDGAAGGQHPFGVPGDLVPFDIGLREQAQGDSSGFELVYERTLRSLQTAESVRRSALVSKAEIARLDREGNALRRNVADQEASLNSRLIELYGTPFSTEIGPGRMYELGYDGPDLEKYYCIERSALFERVPDFEWSVPTFSRGSRGDHERTGMQTQRLTADEKSICVESDENAIRESPGRIQADIRRILYAANDLDRVLTEYGNLIASIEDLGANLALAREVDANEIRILVGGRGRYAQLSAQLQASSQLAANLRVSAELLRSTASAVAEASPKVTGTIVGLSNGMILDIFAPARSAALAGAAQAAQVLDVAAVAADVVVLDRRIARDMVHLDATIERVQNGQRLADRTRVDELERHLRQESLLRNELFQRHDNLVAAVAEYRSTRESAQRLLVERNRFRTRTGTDFEQLRYREMAFRLLRREAADRYRAQFDAAQLDVLMLARQLDFETNLSLRDRERRGWLTMEEELVRTRTLGKLDGDRPVPGGGLTGIVHRLRNEYDDFQSFVRGAERNVTETLDIRQGLFDIPQDLESEDGQAISISVSNDAIWRERLRGYVAPSIEAVPGLVGCCRGLPPGHVLVLPFETPFLANGENLYNHFGRLKGPGDEGFDDSLLGATLTGVEVHLDHYPNHLLGSDPGVYLYPAGTDVFRGPDADGGLEANVRSWNIQRARGSEVERVPSGDEPGWSPVVDGRGQSSWWSLRSRALRSFEASRSTAPDEEDPSTFLTQQHYGRSVYNTRWYLMIPMALLLPRERDYTEEIVDILLGDSGITNIRVVFKIRAFEH